jgi:hypothetical protein
MNEPLTGHEFVKSLLAQDQLVSSTDFAQHRHRVLQRMARARRRERLARWITLSFGVLATAGVAFLAAANIEQIPGADQWPERTKDAAATAFFLFPVAVVLLATLYFLHHRRELRNAQFAAHQHAIAELENQLEELRSSPQKLP